MEFLSTDMLNEIRSENLFKKILWPISIFYYAHPKIMYKLNVAVLFITDWLDTYIFLQRCHFINKDKSD